MRQLTGAAARHAGARCQDLPGFRLRHDQLRSRPVILRRHSRESRVTEPLVRPKRKNPLQADAAAAAARRACAAAPRMASPPRRRRAASRLQVCLDCNAVIYPPRDACPSCLSARLPFRDVDSRRHAGRRNHRADLDRPIFSRAHAVAGRHRQARCRSGRRRPSAWRRGGGRARAA